MSFFETYGYPQIDYNTPEYIQYYQQDGFKEVCKLVYTKQYGWNVHVIDEDYMWAEHKSWVYIIVDAHRVMKIGESQNPLGIKTRDGQPLRGTRCRIGRILSGSGTDHEIRESLESAARQGMVTIWAKKCDIVEQKVLIGGKTVKLPATYHKDLELALLDRFYEDQNVYPPLNKGRK